MYANLRAEMARRKITGNDMASLLKMSQSTFSARFTGKHSFSLDEAKQIKQALETDMSIDELFEEE